MNKSSFILFPFLILVSASTLISCGQDRWEEYKHYTAMAEWMDSLMRTDYYWASEMPTSSGLNYFSTPSTFLSSVKNSSDKVTHVDSTYTESNSYGITATFYESSSNDTIYNALVTYVSTDSPANTAGLKRGDWIMKIGNSQITSSNKSIILEKGSATTLALGSLVSNTTTTTGTYQVEDNKTSLSLPASTSISDDPVRCYTVVSSGSKKVGYLYYGSFKSGTSDKYNNELRKAFASFSSEEITDLVLDLRYNAGGDEIGCAQLLASMLVPSLNFGSTFVTLKHADSSKDEVLTLDKSLIGNGANINLSKIYIITTSATAQLSEVLIAALNPYMSITTIGATTKGYVGVTKGYTNPGYNYIFYPVTSIAVNASDETYTTSGISASKSASDTAVSTMRDFGNAEETMFAVALSLIASE
jgi:C-terminal processing protease CtpA/Prc